MAEKHHTGRKWPSRMAGPAILLALTVTFFWRLVLTPDYTWLETTDNAFQNLPWMQFQASEWHAGRFPLWDPYLSNGQPLIGQAQPGAAYPLNWILFLLPLKDGWIRQAYLHWYYVLLHFLAALGCYWLCRDQRLSRSASVLGGCVFAFSGFIGTLEWPHMLNGAIWAPFVLRFALRSFSDTYPIRNACLAGAFTGLSWLSGHHQMPIYITLTILATGTALLWRKPRRLAVIVCVFLLLSALVGAAQILPAVEYGRLAVRWVNAENPVGWGDRIPYVVHENLSQIPLGILGIAVPWFFRNSNPFLGLAALTLALVAVNRHCSWKVFAAIAAGGLLFSLGSFNLLHGFLYAVLPMLEKARNPSMAVVIFHLAAAVLAAMGLDSLLDEGTCPRPFLRALIVVGLGFYAITAGFALANAATLDGWMLLPALIALLLAGLIAAFARGRVSRTQAVAGVLFLVLFELASVSGKNSPSRLDPKSTHHLESMAGYSDVIEFLRRQPAPVRIDYDDSLIRFNFGDWYGVETYRGYLASRTHNLNRLDLDSERTRDLFGVGYTIAREAHSPNQELAFYAAKGVVVFRNRNALPRAWTVHSTTPWTTEEELRAKIADSEFDLRSSALVRGAAPPLESCSGADAVLTLERHPSYSKTIVGLRCKGMLIFNDVWYPGWKATVDGMPAVIHEVYGALRGVVVPQGTHQVELQYLPLSVFAGALLSIAGALGALVAAILPAPCRGSGAGRS